MLDILPSCTKCVFYLQHQPKFIGPNDFRVGGSENNGCRV